MWSLLTVVCQIRYITEYNYIGLHPNSVRILLLIIIMIYSYIYTCSFMYIYHLFCSFCHKLFFYVTKMAHYIIILCMQLQCCNQSFAIGPYTIAYVIGHCFGTSILYKFHVEELTVVPRAPDIYNYNAQTHMPSLTS